LSSEKGHIKVRSGDKTVDINTSFDELEEPEKTNGEKKLNDK
jgi:hypothetical protein